jgi:hypothetical protein
MDFGALLRRAFDVVWNNKWLILLGMIVALTSGSSNPANNFANSGYDISEEDWENWQDQWEPGTEDFDPFSGQFPGFRFDDIEGFDMDSAAPFLGLGLAVLIPLMCVGITIGLAIWALGAIASGGLVAGVNALDAGQKMTFGEAWRAVWPKGWRLIGIGLIPAIPSLIALISGGGMLVGLVNIVNLGGRSAAIAGSGLGIALVAVLCISGLAALVLSLISYFAVRACILEDAAVFASYSRGWQVLRDNLGQVLILFLIELGIRIGIGLVLLVPNIMIALCCFLWPVALLIEGAVITYFSSAWTLAWRQWTGSAVAGTPAADRPMV